MLFHNVRFPTELSFGTLGGPAHQIEIVELASGHELRNARQKSSRRRYMAGTGVKTLAELFDIQEFFEARMGKLYGFRWKDWSDYSSARPGEPIDFWDQMIARGDDLQTEFRLRKSYQSGGHKVFRDITKPLVQSVKIAIGQRECERDEYQVDPLTGVVVFQKPPEANAPIHAGFEFDVPVRFDCDELQISVAHFDAGEIPNIPVVELMEA